MKRVLSLLTVSFLICAFLCSCSKEKQYIPKTLYCYSSEDLVYTINYTYDDEGKLLRESCIYEEHSLANYSDVYEYNKNGNIVSLTKTQGGQETVYTAEKITKYKYIFTDSQGRTITIIFDGKGHIVSTQNSDGYVSEYAYTYDKSGKPQSIKHLRVNPSGSNRLYEYTVEFTDRDTYKYYETGDNSYYFSVDCIIK